VAVIDPQTDKVEKIIPIPSHNAHRLTLSPSGRKLFTDNEEDATITVVLLFLFSRHSAGSARSASGGNGRHCILAAIPMSAGINE